MTPLPQPSRADRRDAVRRLTPHSRRAPPFAPMAFAPMALAPWMAALGLAAIAVTAPSAHAQTDFPNRPVKVIVSFPPGGPSDIMARAISERMAAALRQPFVIENRGGAAGALGADAVAKSAPDGHTVFYGIDSTVTVTPTITPSMPFKPEDLKPLVMIAASGLTFGAHPGLGVGSVKEFLAATRGKEINFSNAGNGSPGHVAGAILADKTGVKVTGVPYKGNSAAVLALVGGEVPAGILATPGLLPHVKAGKVRALAVTSRGRSALLPEVPTVKEAGLPDLEYEVYYLAMVPTATPEPVVAVLRRELLAALSAPEVRERLVAMDLDVRAESGPEVSALLARLRERYAATIRAAGITAQ